MARAFPLPKQPVIELRPVRRRPAGLPSLLDLPSRVLTHSGRSAIVLALELLGVRQRDGVLVPTYHCPTMVAPIEYVGGTPVFYPITGAGTPDLAYLEACGTRGVRAMLVPHLFGLPRPLDGIAAFCRSRGIALIEDCAHCFFGFAGSAPVGSTGDFAIGSLPKFFASIEGGILASATRSLQATGLRKRPLGDEMRAVWDLVDVAGRSGRLGLLGWCARGASRLRRTTRRDRGRSPDVAALPGCVRTEALNDPLLAPAAARRVEVRLIERSDFAGNVQRRRRNFVALAEGLGGLPDAAPLTRECGPASAPYVVPLLVRNPDEPYARMRDAGLPVFRWDRVWPGTPALPGDSALVWSRGVIQIACHQGLGEAEVGEICRVARACLAPR